MTAGSARSPPPQYRIVPDLVSRRVRATPDAIAFCTPDERDEWRSVSWSGFAAQCARIAEALRATGLGRGDRAGILAPTSMDWECTQMACLALGISVVGIDANYAAAQRDEALRSVKIDALFVQHESSAASIPADVRGRLKRLVTFRADAGPSLFGAVSLDSLLLNIVPTERFDVLAAAQPDDEALVVFSSGTTGQPKPIAYTHRQVLAAVMSILDAFPDLEVGTRLLCWLPLANLFQRIVDFCGIERGATSYVISDPTQVMRYLPRANPHLLIGVPRFYERVYRGINERTAAASRPVSAVVRWAISAGAKRARATRGADTQSTSDRRAVKVAERWVLPRLRKAFGGNMRYLISGSAPMPLWLLDWFDGIGLPVFEAYGVSEDIVPIAMNRPGDRRPATVGRPLAGQDVRLAEDNEILVRGPGVFHGYLAAQGAKMLGPGADGFWATGDYGEFDSEGFLRVTGRKSDVFKSSAGRWIAPADIEALLRRLPYVEHAMAVGAGRRFVVALVSIAPETLARRATGSSIPNTAALPAEDSDDIIRRDVLAATADLAPFQRPAGVLVTTRRFTIEGGELTANLKLRRSAVEANYAAAIQGLLAALEPANETVQRRGPENDAIFRVHWA